ncbi:hypothetical protein GCM10011610_19290 [Nocardia rhizosphaerihabitans]|uniref:Uncharacterized protein n=1 Tax=Nocardia rhizosphaerihabitans TaxID=1691570 RepID=A0ABQ2KCZ5_9NOCA|nr:hypothetical protein GCM10011610_19290 [Nocardia rhizosphaerihabitans]
MKVLRPEREGRAPFFEAEAVCIAGAETERAAVTVGSLCVRTAPARTISLDRSVLVGGDALVNRHEGRVPALSH